MLHDQGIQVNGSFVRGFDHDRRDVFARTVAWIEDARLEGQIPAEIPRPGDSGRAELTLERRDGSGRLLLDR